MSGAARLLPLLTVAALLGATASHARPLLAQPASAGSPLPEQACSATSPEDARAQIGRLTLVTFGSAPAETLGRLLEAGCLAARYDPQSADLIRRRIELDYGENLPVTAEALACKRQARLSTYSDKEKQQANAALRRCAAEFDRKNPQYLELREELRREQAAVEIYIADGESKRSKQIEAEADRLDRLAAHSLNIAVTIPASDLQDFATAAAVAEKFWNEYLADVPASESELVESIENSRSTPEQARREFMSDVELKRSALRELHALKPSAWVWKLGIIETLSSSLLSAGSTDLPDAEAFLKENVALWEGAVADFQRTNYKDAVGIAYFNLAFAFHKIGDPRGAVERGMAAIENLTGFGQRDRLVQAVSLVASEMIELGRFTEAASILFSWLAAFGDEKDLFKNRSGKGKESPRYRELAGHQARIHSALADVLESDERFGEAEPFRRLALEGVQDVSGTSLRRPLIEATFDLALNLAQQGRFEEAAELARNAPGSSGDLIGRALDEGSRAELAAALAVLTSDKEALERWIASAEQAKGTFSLVASGEVVRNKALLFASRGEIAQAEALLGGLISDERNVSDSRFANWVRAELARVKLRGGDTAAAIKLAREAIGLPGAP